MKTPNDIPRDTKSTGFESPAGLGVSSLPDIELTTPSELAGGTRAFNFFEAGHPIAGRFEQTSRQFEIDRRPRVSARRRFLTKKSDRLEESIYWLLSAAVLIYLLLGIIGS
ncbi:MAG: hypothetical protein QOG92_1719 [Verrucomicrobiota bacterium]|jgi:hypothetical protein|nr:hypothetical protein [Verrucomicrobiota bacterium]